MDDEAAAAGCGELDEDDAPLDELDPFELEDDEPFEDDPFEEELLEEEETEELDEPLRESVR